MKTKFAPAERLDKNSIKIQHNDLANEKLFRKLLDALPYPAAILNEQRQIIYGNHVLSKGENPVTIEHILGKRLGEFLNCKFSNLEEGGCGTSEYCKVCGAIRAILESRQKEIKISKECQIIALDEKGTEYSLDFMVTATPFNWNSNKYTVLSVNDISHEKRRKILERIFFHDILNMAGNLKGFFDIVKDVDDINKVQEFLDIADNISYEIIDEIKSHRSLLDAETGELKINARIILSADIMKESVKQIAHHNVATDKIIQIDNSSENITLNTDPVLLNRVLINMLKNALEATDEKETVKIGCIIREHHLVYWVNNPKEMSEKVKLQVFKRSFSTKGTDRGLGTYSIKLLGEQYLNGKVYFESDSTNGTTFYIELPVS